MRLLASALVVTCGMWGAHGAKLDISTLEVDRADQQAVVFASGVTAEADKLWWQVETEQKCDATLPFTKRSTIQRAVANGSPTSFDFSGVDGDREVTMYLCRYTYKEVEKKIDTKMTVRRTGGFAFEACSGGGEFNLEFPRRFQVVDLGIIPVNKTGVQVKLTATNDIDIQLSDTSTNSTNTPDEYFKIVGWCSTKPETCNTGLLWGSKEESTVYKGANFTYSGFNGEQSNTAAGRGTEFISIGGSSPEDLLMQAFPYRPGSAKVVYSWTGTDSDCCRGAAPCGGTFEQTLARRATDTVGNIPKGKINLTITLTSDQDLDVQLFDLGDRAVHSEGKAIIRECVQGCVNEGLIGSLPAYEQATYKGVTYEYSGFNGDYNSSAPVGQRGSRGNEYIRIVGETNTPLKMKLYAYRAGTASVKYTYWEPKS